MLKFNVLNPEALLAPCTKCGTPTDPTNMIEATLISPRKHPRDEDTVTRAQLCLSCWGQRGRAPRAPEPERAPEPHVWAEYSVSKHPDLQAAIARRAKIRETLGLGAVTEIVAVSGDRYAGPDEPHYLVGESPLVAGYDKVKVRNPWA
jgi:hypothetical protein